MRFSASTTPGAHPITSIGELRNGAFETDEELDAFLAFVTESRHADLAWAASEAVVPILTSRPIVPGALPLRLAARLVGKQLEHPGFHAGLDACG
jgi:hypothetical protein